MRKSIIVALGLALALMVSQVGYAATGKTPTNSSSTQPVVKERDVFCRKCGGELNSRCTPIKSTEKWRWVGTCLTCGASHEWISRRLSRMPIGMGTKPQTEPVSLAKRQPRSVPTHQCIFLVGAWCNSMYRKFVFLENGTLLLDGIGAQGRGTWRRPFSDRPDIIRIDHHNLPPAIFFETRMIDGMLDLTQVDPKSKTRLTFTILLDRKE